MGDPEFDLVQHAGCIHSRSSPCTDVATMLCAVSKRAFSLDSIVEEEDTGILTEAMITIQVSAAS